MKILKSKRNRLIAGAMAIVIILSTVIIGTFALNNKSAIQVRLTQPNDYITIEHGKSRTEDAINISTALVNKSKLASAVPSGRGLFGSVTITADGEITAGEVTVTRATNTGLAGYINCQIINPNGIAGYDLPNGGNGYTNEKSGNIAAELNKIQYYKLDAPGGVAENVIDPGSYKTFTPAANTVTWTSLNTEVVDNNMDIQGKGVTILFGKFTDRWGVDQTINYLFGVGVIPGDSLLSDLLDAINKGKDILEDAAQPGNENKYDQSAIDYLKDMVEKGKETLIDPNASDQKIIDDTKDILDAINEIINGGILGEGVVKVGQEYYKPVLDDNGDPTGVWEKTNASGEESTGIYVGGGSTPDPSVPLYKIKSEDITKIPPATNYDDTYPGYLTKSPSSTCEYDTWQKAVNEYVPPTDDIPTGATGRVLSEEQAGDTSTWIEIAQNGSYSLILRSNCEKPNSLFNSTANSRYVGSLLESRMNTFYANLPDDSGLKQYAVMSNATSRIMTTYNTASLSNKNAFSVPSVNKPATTSGVAFALSYQEYATFCSLKNYSGTSPASARSNFNLLKRIGDVDLTESMSRSPDSSAYICFIQLTSAFAGDKTYDGYFHSDAANLDFLAGIWCHKDYKKGWGVRPAMWVDSSIFYE